MNTKPELFQMKKQLSIADKNIDSLIESEHSNQKYNTLLDSAMQQVELCCIELRRIAEQIRPDERPVLEDERTAKTIYGSITLTEEGWVHIKLNTLLPHYKVLGGTQYISDSLSRLLQKFTDAGGELPYFQKAFLAIEEHCSAQCCEAFDHDNKGFKAVVNTLKGRLFPDDDQFELSLGLFTVNDRSNCCHIYVMPVSESARFMWMKTEGGL